MRRRTTSLCALAATLLLAVAAGCGGDEAAQETVAAPAPDCSAARLSPQLPKQALPAKVAATRARIAAAAVRCDYAALARIARENETGFSFSFGAYRSPGAYWRQLEGQKIGRPLAHLVGILALPFTHNETGAFAWPSAYTEKPTAADWDRLVRAGLYTRAQVTSMKRAGSYLGYRTAISADGDWLFFVAGD
jgi:hypothetical protein